jgi:hypothetical protein
MSHSIQRSIYPAIDRADRERTASDGQSPAHAPPFSRKHSTTTSSLYFPAKNRNRIAHSLPFPRIIAKASLDDRDFRDQRSEVVSNQGQQKHLAIVL